MTEKHFNKDQTMERNSLSGVYNINACLFSSEMCIQRLNKKKIITQITCFYIIHQMTICAETRHIRLCFLVLKWHSGVELDTELPHRNVTQSCEGRKGKKNHFIHFSCSRPVIALDEAFTSHSYACQINPTFLCEKNSSERRGKKKKLDL